MERGRWSEEDGARDMKQGRRSREDVSEKMEIDVSKFGWRRVLYCSSGYGTTVRVQILQPPLWMRKFSSRPKTIQSIVLSCGEG